MTVTLCALGLPERHPGATGSARRKRPNHNLAASASGILLGLFEETTATADTRGVGRLIDIIQRFARYNHCSATAFNILFYGASHHSVSAFSSV